jgi:ATP sulfurylase
MIENLDIICTVGPSPLDETVIKKLSSRGADFFRINLSHTPKGEIESKIQEMKAFNIPVMLDTEGCQVRTGNVSEIYFKEGAVIKIYNKSIECDSSNLFLTPFDILGKFEEGDLLHLDFNSVLIKISKVSSLEEGYVEGVVLIEGVVGGRKGVHFESIFRFPPFSEKDLYAIELAKKYNINTFSLSFIHDERDLILFKSKHPNAIFFSKIETKNAVKNIDSILKHSNGVLIDRGDLSREIPIQKIPFVQRYIISKAKACGKKVFVATNTLENMADFISPTRSEVNDVVSTLYDGVTGFALTKETAVGKFPVETLNMMGSLIKEFKNSKDYMSFDVSNLVVSMLPKPHGGKIIDRISFNDISKEEMMNMKRLHVDQNIIMDLEQIAIGSFSPLEGFMDGVTFESVLNQMRLPNGTVWPLPIILQVFESQIGGFEIGDKILLISKEDNEVYGLIELGDIYKINKEQASKKWFLTDSLSHPGVAKFMSGGNYLLGGKINLIKRRRSFTKMYELSPAQVRKIFVERAWSRVVGFHTRNVIHRSHEYIQIEAMGRALADGLFVHPVIGKKKKGDFDAKVIIESYEKMISYFYPRGKVVFSAFSTFSRYSGPREALFTALVRKNFGCSHFIIGRDHTGVGNFYGPEDSQKIFDKFSENEIGIIPIKFGNVFYSEEKKGYVSGSDECNFKEEDKFYISGTNAREMIKKGIAPPEWFMRPEISNILLEKLNKDETIFVK